MIPQNFRTEKYAIGIWEKFLSLVYLPQQSETPALN